MKLSIKNIPVLVLLSIASAMAALDTPPVPVVRILNEVRVSLVLDIPNVYYVLSPSATFATVLFDASGSYDPDGDQLLFGWRYWDDGWSTLAPGATTSARFSSESSYDFVLVVSDGANVVSHEFTLVVVNPEFLVRRMSDLFWQETGNQERYYPVARMLNRSADAYEALQFAEGTHFLHAFTEELKHENSLRQEVRQALAEMADLILSAASTDASRRRSSLPSGPTDAEDFPL